MAQQAQSQRYHRVKNGLFFFGLILDIFLLFIFFFSGLSQDLKAFTSRFFNHSLLINGVFASLLMLGFYLIHFPLSVFSGFIWEHKFELSKQRFSAWLKDDVKGAVLGMGLALILIEVIYVLLGRFPDCWWVGASVFWIFVSFVIAKITPHIIVPLFFKYQSIENPTLKKRIFDLFAACRVGLKDIYAIDLSAKTKKANAFLCGIGKSRRVVLSDTLLSNFNDDEIESVVAHELGHYKHGDIVKLLMVNGMTIFVSFYAAHQYFRYALGVYPITGLDDIAFLPMLIVTMMLIGFITTPLLNAYSRRLERQADRFSIEMTKNPDVFVSMIEKLGKMNLAEFEPGRFVEIFLYDHPPIAKRIAYAKEFRHDG